MDYLSIVQDLSWQKNIHKYILLKKLCFELIQNSNYCTYQQGFKNMYRDNDFKDDCVITFLTSSIKTSVIL